jgi:hypothetical protein
MSRHFSIPTRFALGYDRAAGRRAGILVVAACAGLLVAGTPRIASAVSTRDLIELSKAGLGDDVLVALVEADGTVFNLDAPKILELRRAGVSERVITAMLRNAPRVAPAPEPADAPAAAAPALPSPGQPGDPYFVVIGERPPAPEPAPAPTYVLPWIPWATAPGRPARHARPFIEYRGFGRFINDGWIDTDTTRR